MTASRSLSRLRYGRTLAAAGAITFVEREAAAYDEKAVQKNLQKKNTRTGSHLEQWPCQIKLAPVSAPYFDGAKLLIAADCSAYAYAGMHNDFMRGKITLIGCPKLDDTDYAEKLTAIIKENSIRNVTVARMEVPAAADWKPQ